MPQENDSEFQKRRVTVERERTLAGLVVGLLILAWFGVVLLLYYVPHLLAHWARIGATLSPAQRLLLILSNVARRNFIAIAPLLLIATIAALAWRIRIIRAYRREDADPRSVGES